MRFSTLIRFSLMLFLGAFGMPSLAQDANGARTKCTEFGFKENTKSHEECVKQFLNSMGSAKTPSVKKPISTPPESTSTDDQREDDYWKEAKSVGNKEAFEAYLKFYPRGRYVGLANARISQLIKLESEKIKADSPRNETQKNLPCASTLPDKEWTNCVGTYTWPDGTKYVGGFKNGMLNGQGTYSWADGNKYVGEFKDEKRTGQGSFYFLASDQWKGDIYVGEFLDGIRNGQGTYTFSNGGKYAGEFRNGKITGQGTQSWPNGDKYVGEFLDFKRNGQGTYTFSNGGKYVGEYKDGKRNGRGTFFWASGGKYVGGFRDDAFDGQGTEFGPTGNIIYSGKYLNGEPVR